MTILRALARQFPTLFFDGVLPYICFLLLKRSGLSDSNALAWTALFPGLKVTFDLARSRRIDVVGCVVIWEICLTLALNALFHNARLILLKGPIQVAALGIACLTSIAFRLPLASTVAQLFASRSVSVAGSAVDFTAADPNRLRTVTLAWATVSLIDAALRTVLIFALPTAIYLPVSRMVQWIYFTGLGLWTIGYLRQGSAGPIVE